MELTKVTDRIWYYPFEKERDRPKEYPTTIGIINYSKTGTHVVPAHPKGEA